MNDSIVYPREGYAIQGALFEVYREIGPGFLESVYQECTEREFRFRRIPFVPQQELKLYYKGVLLEQTFRPDFVCYDKIIVELKAVKELAPEHQAQVFNYLRITQIKLGILANFGHYPKIEIQRIVL